MNLQQMTAIIQRGESIAYKGRVITRVDDLPSLAELVESGHEPKDAAVSNLEAERAKLEQDIQAVKRTTKK